FTDEGKSTYAWHFVDVDISKPTYSDSDCVYKKTNEKTCIVKGLPLAIANFRDKSRPLSERLVALRLIVHLAGDLEQPLHNSERGDDGGGNALFVFVSFKATRTDGKSYRRSSTFHSMWDDSLIELQAYSWGSYADAHRSHPRS
ncbi:S1/P1 nuclease, partial [Xanthomonas citri pv. citri]